MLKNVKAGVFCPGFQFGQSESFAVILMNHGLGFDHGQFLVR
jgi:hypothetical protein